MTTYKELIELAKKVNAQAEKTTNSLREAIALLEARPLERCNYCGKMAHCSPLTNMCFPCGNKRIGFVDMGGGPDAGYTKIMDEPETCPRCDGEGIDPENGTDMCPEPRCAKCGGTGNL